MAASTPSHRSAAPQPVRVLLDTNVVLEWLLDRKPWADEAQPLWEARDTGRLITYLPASVLTDIFYIARRLVGSADALAAIDQSLALDIISVTKVTLLRARTLPGSDFEDNVGMACAEAEHLDFIITRNPTDFQQSPIPALSSLDFVHML